MLQSDTLRIGNAFSGSGPEKEPHGTLVLPKRRNRPLWSLPGGKQPFPKGASCSRAWPTTCAATASLARSGNSTPHAPPTKTLADAADRRSDLFERRRTLMQQWADCLAATLRRDHSIRRTPVARDLAARPATRAFRLVSGSRPHAGKRSWRTLFPAWGLAFPDKRAHSCDNNRHAQHGAAGHIALDALSLPTALQGAPKTACLQGHMARRRLGIEWFPHHSKQRGAAPAAVAANPLLRLGGEPHKGVRIRPTAGNPTRRLDPQRTPADQCGRRSGPRRAKTRRSTRVAASPRLTNGRSPTTATQRFH